MKMTDRSVIGYHGTDTFRAEEIVRTGTFVPSENGYDWLGHGVYFWEYAPGRAWQWAAAKYDDRAAVVRATISLGKCLDLTDTLYTKAIGIAYDHLREAYIATGESIPVNKGKARYLDCLVINYLAAYILPECETVRAPFLEGQPLYDGSAIFDQSHIQVVVRKPVGLVREISFAEREDHDGIDT
jgi:hypothetical protein